MVWFRISFATFNGYNSKSCLINCILENSIVNILMVQSDRNVILFPLLNFPGWLYVDVYSLISVCSSQILNWVWRDVVKYIFEISLFDPDLIKGQSQIELSNFMFKNKSIEVEHHRLAETYTFTYSFINFNSVFNGCSLCLVMQMLIYGNKICSCGFNRYIIYTFVY